MTVTNAEVPPPTEPGNHGFLAGDGEMARLMRAKDWSQTPLGSVDGWPQSLKTAVSICLGSKYPIEIWWGPEYLRFYNDAYRPILGPARHPQYLGRPGRECWGELWDVIGPMLDSVRQTGVPTYSEDFQLIMTRHGYPEETYFTFSYGALRDETGGVGGIFCACEETTKEVLSRRRMAVLREFVPTARSVSEGAQAAIQAIATQPLDIPFALIYQFDASHDSVELLAQTGITTETGSGEPAGVSVLQPRAWPLKESLASEAPVVITDLEVVPAGPWPEPPHTAVVFRLSLDASEGGDAALVLGVSSRRALDEDYMGFLQLVAQHVGTTMSAAREFEREKNRVKELQELRDRAEANKAQMLATLESITDGFIALDRDWRFTYANGEAERYYGCRRSELIGRNHWDIFPDLWESKVGWAFRRAVSEQVSCHFENYYEPWHKWFEIRAYPAAEGGLSVYFRDITEEKAAEEERELLLKKVDAERSRLTAAFMHSPAFMCILRGPEHVFEFVNERYYELIGRREILGKPIREALPEIAGQGYFQLLDKVFRTGESFVGNEMRVLIERLPGQPPEECYVDFVFQAVRESDGSVTDILVHGVDVTERKRSEQALREREARFRELADAMPQIVFMARPDGHVDYFNKQWYEYTGIPQGEVGTESWRPVHEPGALERVEKIWSESLRTGRPYEIEYRLRRADGAFRWHLGRALPVKDADGNILRWFGTNTDIHDYKLLQEEKEQLLGSERAARSEAERAGRMKDEFLATLSHELRTPLNAILGWAQLLQGGAVDAEDLAQGMSTIERNARAQKQIIEDLLDMSRIISGKVRLDVQRLDLAPVVEAAVDTIRPAAEAKGIRVQAVLDSLAGPVSGDPNRLQQVFWNLLTNAVKFTPRGGHIQVLLERVNSHLEISVIDTGEGIKPEFLPHVFDRFRQADASTTRRHGGLGLGLSIVKQLVELHGGTVRVHSTGPGNGSTFTVALPLTVLLSNPEVHAERHHPAAEPMSSVPLDTCLKLSGVKVLVVDDEPDARGLVKRLLESCEAIVWTAGSAVEAMQLMQEKIPDVLVSDIGMPGEDGYSLIRRIRLLGPERGGNVPALALTAYARVEDRMKAIRAGFQMHLSKPVEGAELLTIIASLAGKLDG